jgi:hypothetical protein
MRPFIFLLLVLSITLFQACGDNPKLQTDPVVRIDQVDNGDNDNDSNTGGDGNSGGNDDDDNDDDDIALPPSVKSIVLNGRDLNENDETLILPYKEKNYPIQAPIELYDNPTSKLETVFGTINKNKFFKCGEEKQFPCIKNNQVVFAIDIPESIQSKKIIDIVIKTNLYTHWKNKGTEIICLLNISRCSGSAITDNFLSRLFRKNKNDLFWSEDTTIVRNNKFQRILERGKNAGNKIYVTTDARIKLSKILGLNQNLRDEIIDHDILYIVIADDTIITKPKIKIYYQD